MNQPVEKRILILNWRGPNHPQSGGAEVYLTELAQAWSAKGAHVTLLGSDPRNRPLAREESRYENLRTLTMGNRFTVYLLVALFLLRYGRHYDTIVDISNGIPFFAPLFTKSPVTLVVHHVHKLQWPLEFSQPIAWLGWFLESRVVPFVYRHHPVITISHASAGELLPLGFSERQIWVVHPGSPGPSDTVTVDARPNRLLYVGRLKEYKQVDVLIRAVDHLRQEFPDIRLDVVGQGPHRDALQALIGRLNLDNHVILHGYLTEEQKEALFAQAAVFVTASLMEGWGLGIVEANSHGVPVVAYRVPGVNESVRHRQTGYLVRSDAPVQEFAAATAEILRQPDLRKSLAHGGLDWARRFSWADSADKALWVLEHGQTALDGSRQRDTVSDEHPTGNVLHRLNRLPGRLVVLGGFAGTSLVNYAFGLLMAALLLPGDFGLLAFAQTILLLAGLLLNSGYAWSLTAELPRAGHTERGRLVRGTLVANLGLALALSALILVLFAAGPIKAGLERWSVAGLIALAVPSLSIVAIGRGAMRGVEAFGSMTVIQVSEVAAKLLGALALVGLGYGPVGAVAGFLVGAALAAALSLALISRELDISLLGERVKIAPARVGGMFAAVLGMALLLNLDILAVKLFAGGSRALTGHYQAAIMLANIPYFMTTALLAVLFPQLAAAGRLEETGPRLAETLRLILIFLIPVELALVLAPEFFLEFLFPSAYVAAAPQLRILALGNLFLILAATLSSAFQATGHARIPGAVLLAIVAVESIGLRLVVPTWQATGAAAVFSAGGFLALLFLAGSYASRLRRPDLGAASWWLARYALAILSLLAVAIAGRNWTGQPLFWLVVALIGYGLMLIGCDLLRAPKPHPSGLVDRHEKSNAHSPPGL